MNNNECDEFMKRIAENMKDIGTLEAITNMKLHELVEGFKSGDLKIIRTTHIYFDRSGVKEEFESYNKELENLRGEGSI